MSPRKKRPTTPPEMTGHQPADQALALRADAGGTLLPVRVVPRAARMGLDGVRAGALVARLTAPPVEGAANSALIAFLASQLDVPKTALTIASGATSRQKTVRVAGLEPAEVRARLGLPEP